MTGPRDQLRATFEESHFEIINNAPLKALEQTLEDIASNDPAFACHYLHRSLETHPYILPYVKVEMPDGIRTEMDGDAALAVFMQSIRNNLVGGTPIQPQEIVLSTFRGSRKVPNPQERIIIPAFTISLEPPAIAI